MAGETGGLWADLLVEHSGARKAAWKGVVKAASTVVSMAVWRAVPRVAETVEWKAAEKAVSRAAWWVSMQAALWAAW